MEKKGLSTADAKTKLAQTGLNQLPSKKTYSVLKLLSAQFKNLLVWLLIFASILSYIVGHVVDGTLILIILVLNIGLGFWQEFKASKELEGLRKLEVAFSRVYRDGKQVEIPSTEIVPGDLVILESGDRIPADGSLVESFEMYVNQSALTGESLPVVKTKEKDENELFFGTTVSSGRGVLQVEKTGVSTKFGQLALTLTDIEEEKTPLEISLNGLARNLGLAAIFVAVVVFGLRLFQGYEVLETLTSSIALMVAVVPEGLPAVVTVMLAFGVRKMYSKKTLVRKMSAVESLGATSVICTDKTGTLTRNEMSVRKVFALSINLNELIACSIICNSSSLVIKEDSPRSPIGAARGEAGNGSFDILGDTTEGALLLWAKEKNHDFEQIRSQGKILEEEPFNSEKRRMSVLWEQGNKVTLFTKGAPESILPLCKISPRKIKEIENSYKDMALQGLRVLAFAKAEIKGNKAGIEKLEKDLDFLGLIGVADSARLEAKQAIEKARRAGITTVMVTGDNELTAKAIAKDVGLLEEGDEVLTGANLDELSDEELNLRIEKVRIFARVLPEHKLRIVRSYQRLGKIVAVTGDGVNDALALKQAHVGVAMGQTGTDVAKEASDIIILDDNLSTIVTAIEEGRRTYNNIFKVVKFLLTGNLSEVLVIVGAAIIGLPSPLSATQILWINFVTDGLPALSLAADDASENTMKALPRNVKQSILDFGTIKFICMFALLIALITLGSFLYAYYNINITVARAWAFSLVVILQMVFIFIMRTHHSIFSNKYLLVSVGLVVISQVLIITVPFLKNIFGI
ncbi:cation-translocating P-type ATPase [Candidatus Daviesbacteria bacterium]|nr:cation-translocating P-type ATPase [Candidatus Daviesbacteria bacterium]